MAGTLRQAMVFLGLADDGYEPQRDQDGRLRDGGSGSTRQPEATDTFDVVDADAVSSGSYRASGRSAAPETAAMQEFAVSDDAGARTDRGTEAPRRGPARAPESAAEEHQSPVRGAGRRETARRNEVGEEGFRAPVTPINRAAAQIESDNELRRITTIHPRSYNDAKAIGESFRENIPVIMNVTDMDVAEAKRLVDFSSGLTFALNGSIERVTEQVFLLTPANLEVLGNEESEPAANQESGLPVFNQN